MTQVSRSTNGSWNFLASVVVRSTSDTRFISTKIWPMRVAGIAMKPEVSDALGREGHLGGAPFCPSTSATVTVAGEFPKVRSRDIRCGKTADGRVC